MAKERRVGQHGDGSGNGCDDEHGVDHRVVVVGGDDHAAVGRNPLTPDDVDPTVEEPQQQPDHHSDEAIGDCPLRFPGPRRAGGMHEAPTLSDAAR